MLTHHVGQLGPLLRVQRREDIVADLMRLLVQRGQGGVQVHGVEPAGLPLLDLRPDAHALEHGPVGAALEVDGLAAGPQGRRLLDPGVSRRLDTTIITASGAMTEPLSDSDMPNP